jgi:hypothetical protein
MSSAYSVRSAKGNRKIEVNAYSIDPYKKKHTKILCPKIRYSSFCLFFFFRIKDILKCTRSPTAFLGFHFCPSESKVPLNTYAEITVKYWKGKELVIEC